MRNFFTSILMFALSVSVIGASLLSPVFVHGQPFLPEDNIDEGGNFDPSFGLNDLVNEQGTDLSIPEQDSLESVAPEGSFTSAVSQSPLPACGISVGRWFSSVGTIEGCFIRIIYFGVLYPSAFIAGVGGSIFDYLVAYTLNSNSYVGGPESFIEQGWRVLRDIANVSFIFILLYSAIRFILGLDSQSIGKTVARIILVALVINFSLFATRVIVDAGNILGRVFYESIDIQNDAQGDLTGRKSISSGLISLFNPQRLLTSEMFTSYANQSQASLNQVGGQNTLGGAVNETPANGFIILILLIASAMNILIAYIFFSVGIFLIARTVGLWIMMIMSPLAFASVGIPALKGKMGKFGFDGWLSQTISLSFLVVVFLFFLYLTVMFLQIAFNSITSTILGGGIENASAIQIIMSVVIPFAIVFFLMTQAKSQAKQMAGDFGSMAVKGLKMAVIGALGTAGLALGGAALVGGVVGRQLGGRFGAQMTKKEATGAWGRARVSAGKYLQNSTFDVRNVKIPKPLTTGLRSGLSYATGKELGAGDFAMNMDRLGGPSSKTYKSVKEQRVKEKTEKAKDYVASEETTLDVKDTSYTHTDANGKKSTATLAGKKISVAQAKEELSKEQKKLEEEKERVHRVNDYEGKKQALADKEKEVEKQENKVAEKQKSLEEMLRRKQSGDNSVSQSMIDNIRRDRDAEKIVLGRREREKKNYKDAVRSVEAMYKDQVNAVEQAKAFIGASKRALHGKNSEIYNDYAKSLENWAPPQSYNYRGPANKEAASNIRSMANKEESKS